MQRAALGVPHKSVVDRPQHWEMAGGGARAASSDRNRRRAGNPMYTMESSIGSDKALAPSRASSSMHAGLTTAQPCVLSSTSTSVAGHPVYTMEISVGSDGAK